MDQNVHWLARDGAGENYHWQRVGIPCFESAADAVESLACDSPIYVLYPEVFERSARAFVQNFPGRVLYAIKANPHEVALRAMWIAGVRDFDIASLHEAHYVRSIFPEARLYFMHPVKSRRAIRETYALGIRDYALDSLDELAKILEETGGEDLNLHVRLAVGESSAAYDLSGKFGTGSEEAVALLQAARKAARGLGITFHVGSQCMDPRAYARALERAIVMVSDAGVELDSIDVGGGFPVRYPGMCPPPMQEFFDVISSTIQALGLDGCELMGEPGRALSAAGGSTLARVELRRGNDLYINDGVYGSLFDAGFPGWRYPVALIPADNRPGSRETLPFRFFGPTCDSIDRMAGPFHLPADIREGDWIEIQQLGAYGQAMATRFNGFYSDTTVAVTGQPRHIEDSEL